MQELIAPTNFVFLNQSWTQLGTKRSLTSILYDRTGIDLANLTGDKPLQVVQLHSACRGLFERTTTRIADMSYRLLLTRAFVRVVHAMLTAYGSCVTFTTNVHASNGGRVCVESSGHDAAWSLVRRIERERARCILLRVHIVDLNDRGI